MPRHRRLNIPGAIHHVITRGLNRQDIFLDDCDRNDFLGRLEKNLSLTGCRCYAWVLMSNHLHLLIENLGDGVSLII
ncbi:MAG: transposase [Deltaproteobacteria bacterium]|nr:transposase [Deltaproteobacteria bacterium]MBW1939543.1 transposase [Deltaproteobacteria bacterium]